MLKYYPKPLQITLAQGVHAEEMRLACQIPISAGNGPFGQAIQQAKNPTFQGGFSYFHEQKNR